MPQQGSHQDEFPIFVSFVSKGGGGEEAGRGKPMSLWESMFTSVESKECFESWCPIHSMGSRSQDEAKQVRSEILP
jgi:hypothetical protein